MAHKHAWETQKGIIVEIKILLHKRITRTTHLINTKPIIEIRYIRYLDDLRSISIVPFAFPNAKPPNYIVLYTPQAMMRSPA